MRERRNNTALPLKGARSCQHQTPIMGRAVDEHAPGFTTSQYRQPTIISLQPVRLAAAPKTPLETRAASAVQMAEQNQVPQAQPKAQEAEEGVGARGGQASRAEQGEAEPEMRIGTYAEDCRENRYVRIRSQAQAHEGDRTHELPAFKFYY